MKGYIYYAIIGFIVVLILIPSLNDSEQEKDFEVLVENLDTVWAIDFLPNGDLIFTERPGRVSLFNGETKAVIAELNITEISESGLAGVAADPDFEENNYIYLYYTYQGEDDIYNRVSRFTLSEGKLIDEEVLLDNIPSARFHDGGRIGFGPDNKLYITTGDATEPSSAQEINSLAGKILRMNKDGSIPQNNPFNNYVYSYGHRNPQGLAWNKETFFSAEHGPRSNDELNIIGKGVNYGWPLMQCDETSQQYKNPVRCFSEFTLAPAGIAIHNNNVYIAGLRSSQVRKLTMENDKVIEEKEFISDLGRIRAITIKDDFLYIGTSNWDGRGIPRPNDDKIIRIKL